MHLALLRWFNSHIIKDKLDFFKHFKLMLKFDIYGMKNMQILQ